MLSEICRAYLKRYIGQVLGDTVGMDETAWKNGTHSRAHLGQVYIRTTWGASSDSVHQCP